MQDDANTRSSATYLVQLADELQRRGWRVELRGDGRLLVVNPQAGDLRDLVECRRSSSGWGIFWSWGDVITSIDPLVDPVPEAADKIMRVLRAVDSVSES